MVVKNWTVKWLFILFNIFNFLALQSLATLVLENTGVTDAGIIQYITDISIHQPPNLKCLNLNRTAVTQKIFGPLTGTVVPATRETRLRSYHCNIFFFNARCIFSDESLTFLTSFYLLEAFIS